MKKTECVGNKQSKYEEKEKIYHASKKNRKLTSAARVFVYMTGLILSVILVYAFLNVSLVLKENHTTRVNYTEKGSSSFKVYLNDNTYYDNSYLESGMHYVSSLINVVNATYKYEIHALEKINYKYNYDVVSKIVITEKNEADNVLFTKNEVLVKNKSVNKRDTNFVIDENIDIDYSKYNDYVNNYKKDYSLDVDAKVIVSMNVKAVGTMNDSKDKINKNRTLDVVIPLSRKTIDISTVNDNISTMGTLSSIPLESDEANLFLIISIIFAILSLYWIYKIVYTILTSNKNKSLYEITIKKYLKEYDRAIVETGTPDIDESKYKQVIKISRFQELLDLHDNFQYPIFHYEVEEGCKSYFVVIKDDILYKLTISQAYLEKNGVN